VTGDDENLTGPTRRAFLLGTGAVAGALTLGGLAACGGGSDDDADEPSGDGDDEPTAENGGGRPADGDAVVDEDVADEALMMGWITEVFDKGIRRPGYEADIWAEGWIEEQFRSFGLEDVRLEPVDARRWEDGEVTLEVTGTGGTRTLDAYPVPYSTPVDGLEVELMAFDVNDPAGAKDKAALCDVTLLAIPADLMAGAGSLPEDRSRRIYDPDGTIPGATHITPSQAGNDIEEVAEGGGAAFIGSLKDHPGNPYKFYVPYDAVPIDIPGVYVSGTDGQWLHEQLAAGPVTIKLSVETSEEDVVTNNVIGELPGADDDVVIIGSHHDGPWASAVEDGSGIAMVLAQAKYWARRRQEDRPHRMVFILQAAHMAGWTGQRKFVEDNPDLMERTVLQVHLEHAAREFVEEGGELVDTGLPVPRWFFTSRIPELEETVYSAFEEEDLKRSLILAPDAVGGRPPTDGVAYYDVGVPVFHFLGTPWYLFDEFDTLDKVDNENLVGITRTVIRVVGSTAGTSAADMRAAMVAGDPTNPEHGVTTVPDAHTPR
jgi:hypothetical protein